MGPTMTYHDPELLPTGMLIGGRWRDEGSGGFLEHVNPTTGKPQRTFPIAGPAEVDEAVRAARAALPTWRRLPVAERRRALHAIGALIRDHREELSVINALETGTPVQMTRARLSGDSYFEYYAGWLEKLTGRTLVAPDGAANLTYLEPVGVVASILTWNSPMGGVLMSVAAALAAGCTVVIKPPEQAPFAVIRFGQLCDELGLPPGTINIVPGAAVAGEALVQHRDIDKISFTGGPATARRIQASAAASLTPLVLELGGKSASIVFSDADLGAACDFSTIITKLSGQGCSLPSRLLVHEDVYDEIVAGVVARFRELVIGDPMDDDTVMGRVINEAACERILGMIERAVTRDGATIRHGGARVGGELSDGYFIEPTLLSDGSPTCEIGQEEVFGPVLSVLPFAEEAEAISLANETAFGLAAYVHTRDVGRALRVAAELDAGSVALNGAAIPAGHASPFGGIKQSGYGRQGGREGIAEFLRTKNVLIPAN
jgi:aldehyde dehydrogenase (NAD+)